MSVHHTRPTSLYQTSVVDKLLLMLFISVLLLASTPCAQSQSMTLHIALGTNVFNFLYNTLYCKRSLATAEITRVGGRYAVQDHSPSLMFVSIKRLYATS